MQRLGAKYTKPTAMIVQFFCFFAMIVLFQKKFLLQKTV